MTADVSCHPFECLAIIRFAHAARSVYCVWYSDEGEDGFLTDPPLPKRFGSEQQARTYIREKISYGGWISGASYDLDAARKMARDARGLDPCLVLDIWNIAGDLASSLREPFGSDGEEEVVDRIYDELFCGGSLPGRPLSGPEFTPSEQKTMWEMVELGCALIERACFPEG